MNRGPSAGYTLTELMLVTAIIGIVASVGALVSTNIFKAQMMSDALANIQQGAFSSFDTISKLLRQADNASVVIDRYDANQPPWSRVTFNIPGKTNGLTFYQKERTLYFGNIPTAGNLRSLNFAYLDTKSPGVMTVSMTFEKATGSGNSKAIQLFIQKVKIQN